MSPVTPATQSGLAGEVTAALATVVDPELDEPITELGIRPDDLVVVDEEGLPVPKAAVPLRLRYAKAVRVSVEGNAHFCRGLLATRYDDEPLSTRITDTRRRAS